MSCRDVMHFEADGTKLKLSVSDEDDMAMVHFKISSAHLRVNIEYDDPCFLSKEEWISFRDHIEAKETSSKRLQFYKSTGCTISYHHYDGKGHIGFDASNYRDGGGGTGVSLNCEKFGAAFVDMLNHIIDEPEMNKKWAAMNLVAEAKADE